MAKTVDGHGAVGPASRRAEEALEEVLAGWNRAADTWDVQRLAALYTEDALMFCGRAGLSVGVPGMRAYFGSYLGQLASTHLNLVDQYLVELAPEVWLAQGFGDFRFRLASGQEASTTMRTTLVLVLRDGR